MSKVKRTERGWAGHFCASSYCNFKRNTLLECGDTKVVVSTVGAMDRPGGREQIGLNRYYETMMFPADPDDEFLDAITSKELTFYSPWAISEEYADIEANDMHEAVVDEITCRLKAGETFPYGD